MSQNPVVDYDIVVVGCGVAGLSAALSAAEASRESKMGLRILVLERTGPDKKGGNSRWTGAFFRLLDEKTLLPASFVEDVIKLSGGRTDESYVRRFAEKIPPTLEWVKSKGVKFGYAAPASLTTRFFSGVFPLGGGYAIVDALSKQAESLGVEFSYFTTAWKLSLRGEDGTVGVTVRGSDGKSAEIRARSVVLASGGFEGNPEMLTRYLGRGAYTLKTLAPGGLENKGEGIRMALEVGARASGQWDFFNTELVDSRSKKHEALVLNFPFGILVDSKGKRFSDEGASILEDVKQDVARSIFFDLPDHRAFVILDQKSLGCVGYERTLDTDQQPIMADSIQELAKLAGLPADTLADTVREFNNAVQPGSFDSAKPDGKHTLGITPPKSNWALEVDSPPYYCYPIEVANVFTFGGIATDERAQVLSADNFVIPGLYAAGEMTGVYYEKYPGKTSVLRGLVFGKIAGEEAVRYLSSSAK